MSDEIFQESPTYLRHLAQRLVPLVAEACDGRLGEVTWFKADWQRGGAATGTAIFRSDNWVESPVVLKLPVGPRELTWTRRLQSLSDELPVIPRLYASGEGLDDYDLAWIVIERLPFGPLGSHWHDDHITRIAEAAAQFHAAANRFEIDQPPRREDWDDLVRIARKNIRINNVPNAAAWNEALKQFSRRVDGLVTEWRARPIDQWLHGDLHLANAMSRSSLTDGPVALIDLAEVHAGHWIEDAVYLERQLWARHARLQAVKPVRAVARARKALGLAVETDYPRLAMIRRALLAATAPAFIRSEGHPSHLEACLRWLNVAMNELN